MHIDGRLDEPVWRDVPVVGDFVQMDPNEGAPVSERTEFQIFYDDDKLYIGMKCYDSNPKGIVSWLDARDTRPLEDSVGVFLDPFGDRRNGYGFTVHVSGHQWDGVLTEGVSEPDQTWDGVWQSAVHIADWGYSVEFAIPFKTMRFSTDKPWGFNIRRDIARKNERAYWQFVPRFDQRSRPSTAGTLEGIENISPGRNIELVPHISSRFRRGAGDPLHNGNHPDGGADLRWGILPNATLNLTINPDFADTETDEANISLSRFELFFPEKRQFFNEGANLFATPLNLFFTRRVGARLPDGDPQRIYAGAKLTGKLAGWSLGLLDARTEETRFLDPATNTTQVSPGANFFVLRMQRDIWRHSTIGFLTVNRDQQQIPGVVNLGSTQRVHAIDLHIVSGTHIQWSNQVSYNQNHTTSEGGIHRVGLTSQFKFDSDAFSTQWGYKYLGRGYDVSAIGFEPEVDRHAMVGNVIYKPFINRGGVRRISFELNQDISMGTRGELEDAGSDLVIGADFKNFWSATAVYSYDRIRFNGFTSTPNCAISLSSCALVFNTLPRTQVYIDPKVRFAVSSNQSRSIFFTYSFTNRKGVEFNENFYGRQQNHILTTTMRLFHRTRIEFSGQYYRELLLDRTPFQDRRLFITRVNHQFTPKLRFRVLGQVSNDRHGQNFNINSIVAYDFTARSAAIVGYNYQRHSALIDPSIRRGDLGNELFFKFSYLIHF